MSPLSDEIFIIRPVSAMKSAISIVSDIFIWRYGKT
jgi:hypothetical protein